ncbi:GntR family transcriptional regulator [Bacillus norwichensis]|uniref:GntR family transcriptional regulator n=1 Tax=Bacillus norwichensis TaxID=2762217 RepID=A0ABR8VIE8_9BACI|nr:GntR family transcriptional regulator [Bacillus norwichensis]MBD8004535.1 GntR family transcriptional regulator [Bacillus norwichensis]
MKNGLENKIYKMLKAAIINRELPPGTKLSEQELADTLNVSRTPIRSALRRLSYEMYVKIIPRRGAFVNQPTLKEVEDVFEMRILLEDFAVMKACQSHAKFKSTIQSLEGMIQKEKEAYASKNIGGVLENVYDFHIEIAKISQNDILINQLRELISLTNIYLTFYSEMDLDEPASPQEHADILEAIKVNDEELARNRMKHHINKVIDRLNFGMLARNDTKLETVLSKYI